MKEKRERLRNKFLNQIRYFNRAVFNRFTLAFAESSFGPYSVIYHRGRRSGKTYRTPVMATYVGETVIIPLSYGAGVDWLKNVLAQGGCEIVRKKRRMTASNPQVIEAEAAYTLLPEDRRRLFARFKLEKFVRMELSG